MVIVLPTKYCNEVFVQVVCFMSFTYVEKVVCFLVYKKRQDYQYFPFLCANIKPRQNISR
jgi:hypothetical protein